ncbi:MAG: flagellar hook-associated protein FlgL [Succinivibrio sp.]|nr:flagellar hook-associated protein FlgL [Succinivibrio sp.]
MRISTTMQFQNHLKYIQRSNSKLDEDGTKFATGEKFTTAGEDPSGMGSKIKYENAIAAYTQYAKSAGLAADTLAEEETALATMWSTLSSINTRLIQAVDGTNDSDSLDAIAEDIEQCKFQLFDLMNTQNAEGEYIFSGAQSGIPTMTLTSSGQYYCQADGSTRKVQVAPNVTVQVSDSGQNIFQNCAKAHTFSMTQITNYDPGPPATTTNVGTNGVYAQVTNYGNFENLYKNYYQTSDDPNLVTTATTNNTIHLVFNDDGTFVLQDKSGNTIPNTSGQAKLDTLTGTYSLEVQGLGFNGLTLPAAGTTNTIDLQLNTVEKDNILNVLTDCVSVLRDTTLSPEERNDLLAQAQVTVQNAMDQYDMYRGRVGARQRNIDNVLASDQALSDIKENSKAIVSSVDAFEAASAVTQDQQLLEAARQVYTMLHGTSLFDYI